MTASTLDPSQASGPLKGLKIVEMVGLGPGPFCAMMLSDMGAEVIRITQKRKPGAKSLITFEEPRHDLLARGRRSLAIDLKKPEGQAAALRLIEQSDALIEGFRPGVMERLNLSPEVCLTRNPRLVYGRMTGWGQTGPLSQSAGHDINYIALTGALHGIGEAGGPPTPPINLLGDFGGGAMMLAFGLVCALLEAQRSGQGQVVDAAVLDGTAVLSTLMYSFKAIGQWTNQRADNWLDGGEAYYGNYACADGRYISIGPLEPQFYSELCQLLGLDEAELPSRHDRLQRAALRQRFTELFMTRTRDQWCELLEGTDACVAPVLDWDEAPKHPHNIARGVFVEVDGVTQPAPAPRFSRTPSAIQGIAARDGEHTEAVFADWGWSEEELAQLRSAGAI